MHKRYICIDADSLLQGRVEEAVFSRSGLYLRDTNWSKNTFHINIQGFHVSCNEYQPI